jgi:hypothetical protein
MRAQWVFKSYRPVNPHDRFQICRRYPIRRSRGPFIGTQSEALAFARRACEHLSAKGVVHVEAWSEEFFAPEPLPGSVTFRVRPHENGKDWRVLEGPLQHPAWVHDLDQGIDHMLFRGVGRLCCVEVLNAAGAVARLILVDQSTNNPYAGVGPTWKQS